MNKKHICIDARMLDNSGIGVYIKNIIPYLNSDFFITLLILKGYKIPNELNGINFIHIKSKIYTISEQIELFFKIPICDLFWSPHYNIPVLPIKAKKRVVTIHDVYHLANFSTLSFFQKIYTKIFFYFATTKNETIVTVSNFSKNEIIKYTSTKKKISVIYNGINHLNNDKNFHMLKDFSLPEKYILFVGNVKPHKNLKIIVEALAILKNKNVSIPLVIVGKRKGFISGDEAIANITSDDIIFTEYVPDEAMSSLYKNAKLFVFPSLYEGFGFPPLEALINGCEILCSNYNPMPEICEDFVTYFDPKNPEELANLIQEKYFSEYTPSKENIKKALEKYNWETSGNEHLIIFKNLV